MNLGSVAHFPGDVVAVARPWFPFLYFAHHTTFTHNIHTACTPISSYLNKLFVFVMAPEPGYGISQSFSVVTLHPWELPCTYLLNWLTLLVGVTQC